MNVNLRRVSALLVLATLASCVENQVADVDRPVDGPMIINELSNSVPGELMIKVRPQEETKAMNGNSSSMQDTREIAELLAESDPDFTLERLFPECGRFEERTREEGLDSWYIARFDRSLEKTSEIVKKLRNCSSVELIEYSPKLRMYDGGAICSGNACRPVLSSAAVTRKERFPFNESADSRDRQWHYNNTGLVMGKPSLIGADANVWKAWTLCTGSPDVIVAVVDQGIMYDHEDLSANMWVNAGEIPDNGIDDDGNGYVDDIYGFNFIDGNNHIFSSAEQAHGTHVAGTIAAVNNNALGVNGIAGGSGNGTGYA